MSQGIEDRTEMAKTHTASSSFTDRGWQLSWVLGREGNETHKRDTSKGIGISRVGRLLGGGGI